MSNMNKDHPSIRVHAPPGGRSANIFGVPEPEQPVSTKKHHMQSDIFGCKSPSDAAPTKPTTRPMTNNIFGNDPEPVVPKNKVYSEKNRSTIFDEAPPSQPSNKPDRQRSNIFAASEPVTAAPTRPVADKFKSNIFGSGDDEQNKRQPGTRQGLRDGYRPSIAISLYSPLRKWTVGYNPINGEPYATKDNVQNKLESLEINEKKPEGDEGEVSNGQDSTEKSNNGHDTVTNGKNGQTATTSVRVVHPPGGRSNGPLW